MASPIRAYKGYGKTAGYTHPEHVENRIKAHTEKVIALRNREKRMIEYFTRNEGNCFNIEPMPHVRQRLDKPMTAEERLLRKQWLKDQLLSPNEPRHIPEATPRNIFRRMWHGTFNGIANAVEPYTGSWFAPRLNQKLRYAVAMYITVFVVYYHINYIGKATWQNNHGITVIKQKPLILPCDPTWPNPPTKADFNDLGFSQRTAYRQD